MNKTKLGKRTERDSFPLEGFLLTGNKAEDEMLVLLAHRGHLCVPPHTLSVTQFVRFRPRQFSVIGFVYNLELHVMS